MASSPLAAPGTRLGPCAEPCNHRDCADTRRMAESRCSICLEPIGYDRHMYADVEGDGPTHAACLEDALDAADRSTP